jgi:DNA-binding NtrC family response regulator
LETLLNAVEKNILEMAMLRNHGNKSRVARIVGYSRPKLYRRLAALKIEQC